MGSGGVVLLVNLACRRGSSWRPVRGFDAVRVRRPWQASTWGSRLCEVGFFLLGFRVEGLGKKEAFFPPT